MVCFNQVQPFSFEVYVSSVCPNRKDAHTGQSEQLKLTHLRRKTSPSCAWVGSEDQEIHSRPCPGTRWSQPWDVLGHVAQGSLKNRPLWVRDGENTIPCTGWDLLRRHLAQMGEVKAAAMSCSQVRGNVSMSKRLCWPEMLLHYSALKNIFHLRTDTSLKPVLKAPSQSVVTMASFSSADASGEISTSACMVLIKTAKQSQYGLSRKPCGGFVHSKKGCGIHSSWGGTCVNAAALG